MYIAIKTSKTDMKNKILRKTRNGRLIIFNGKLIIMYLCNYVTVQFRQGQECSRCDQIRALNKNSGDLITLSVFYHYVVLKCLQVLFCPSKI